MFNITKEDSPSFLIQNKEAHLLNEKKNFRKNARKNNKDNIYRKIKRSFLNKTLINKLNAELKNMGSWKYFCKFPQNFASNITKDKNKVILDMTLLEIFKKYELIKKILNKTFSQLYTEYINSDEFKNEINRLKVNKKENDYYIKRYIILSKNLLNFFCQ